MIFILKEHKIISKFIKGNKINWQVNDSDSNLLVECRELLQQMKEPMIQHELREQNKVADLVAKKGKVLTPEVLSQEWNLVSNTVEDDKKGSFFW